MNTYPSIRRTAAPTAPPYRPNRARFAMKGFRTLLATMITLLLFMEAAPGQSALDGFDPNSKPMAPPAVTPTPTPAPIATPPNVLGRLSTRALVQTGNNILIGGSVVTGSGTKKVLIRALGPTLAGVAGRLGNPTLELRDGSGSLIASNDNWRDTQEAEIEATGQAPSNDLESAILATISPGNYAAIVQGKNNTTGVGKVDVIDVDTSADSKLARMSNRAFAGTETNVIVGEFTINGPQLKGVIIRGLGPSLIAMGVPNALVNPTLELRDSNGALIFANDDWQDDPSQAAIIAAAGLAPSHNFESAIAATLSPGSYTVRLAGLNCGTGVALVEVYDRGSGPGLNTLSIPVSSGPLQGEGCTAVPPVITSPLNAAGVVDRPFTYQFAATGATSLGVSNLPAGLTFNTTLAAITGTPTTAGMFQVALSASNSAGTAKATLTIDVQPPPAGGPVIMSGTAATGRPGSPFLFQVITTGGTPAARVSAIGLPAGLSINDVSGLISGTPAAEGSSAVILTVTDGAFTASATLQLTFTSDLAVPVIVSPSSAFLTPGQFFSYTINAPSNADPLSDPTTFTLIGTLPEGLSFNATTGTISGTFNPPLRKSAKGGPLLPAIAGGALLGSVQLFGTNSHGTSTLPLLFLMPPTGVINLSTRMRVGTGDNVLIGGFIITGNAPKVVIIRAIGPSTGLPGALPDPKLELHDSASNVVPNNNWGDNQRDLIIGTGIPPGSPLEAAIVIGLDPGPYTAIVADEKGRSGIALVEVYDLGTGSIDPSGHARLAQISTRGFVETGDDVMIGGFILSGQAPQRVLVRAIGPSLPVAGKLADANLELRGANGALIRANNDWRMGGQEADIIATGIPPTDDLESALIETLPAGGAAYTAIVSGVNGTSGVALVEVYSLP